MTIELLPEKDPGKVPDGKVDKLIGEVLANRYQIEQLLGEGAMGSVYRARHVKVGRSFAVKVLHKKLLEDRKVAQRFDREAELAGRLRHPNVIGVVDVGEIDSMRYMVMDFAEGNDLATLLGEAPMTAERILSLTRQMCEGLYHAHEQGLIHRDFKPENVIVERDDHNMEVPRIVDFGIAILREGGDSVNSTGRLTTNGLVLGTPHYMAPEQAVADPIDHRIDLFALGIVVYEMLCGKLPFDGTGAEVARANLLLDPPLISQRVPYLEVDPLLEAFSRRLMAKKREHRPATAKLARELLDMIEKDRPAAAAALGVPLNVGSRTQQITEPSQPTAPDNTGLDDLAIAQQTPVAAAGSAPALPAVPPGASTPELVAATSTVAREATPMPTPVERAESQPPARSQHHIPTAQTAPITWEGKRRRNRRWLMLAALGAFGIAATITAVAMQKSKSKPAEARKVVMNVGSDGSSEMPSDPGSNAAANPGSGATGPGEIAAGSNDGAKEPGPGPDGPDGPGPDVDDTGKKPEKHRDKPDKRIAKIDPKPKNPKTDPKKGDPKKGDQKLASGSATVVESPGAKSGPDTNTVIAQYQSVGADLKKLRAKAGDSAVEDLDQKYRIIQIQDAISSQPKRESAANVLADIRREIKKRMPD